MKFESFSASFLLMEMYALFMLPPFLYIFVVQFANANLLKLSFEQPLDHFNGSSAITNKFNQTYYIWDDHWDRSNGPLFIFIGYTSPLLPEQFTKAGTITEAAERFKALVLAIEQRYYGESLTYDMLRREKLPYLTSQQTLEDMVSIQKKVMNDYNMSASAVKIIFGNSFGGFHAPVAFCKASNHPPFTSMYPQMVDAAFASSAPVWVDYNAFRYWSTVSLQLKNRVVGGSLACYNAVKQGFLELDRKLSDPIMHWNDIADAFRFCPRYLENITEKDTFAAGLSISGSFGNLANMNNIHPGISIRELLCPIFTNRSMTPYSALKQFHTAVLDFQKKDCINATWADLIATKLRYKDGIFHWDEYKANPGERAYWWEVCSHFGFITWCDRSKQCILSSHITMEGVHEICRQAFNISPLDMQLANANLKAHYGDRFMSASRIFASSGVVDPWYYYEIAHANPDREIYAYTISEMGHVSDAYPRSTNESEPLTAAREFQLGVIKKWIDDLKQLDLNLYNWWFSG